MSAVSFDTVDPTSPDAREAIECYFAELDDRFTTGFDPGHGGADADVVELAAPSGAFVVIRDDAGSVIGCGGVQRIDDETGEIKRMWIDPSWRGGGLGPRLLAHLEQVARDLGRSSAILDTNEVLHEAVAMYERNGYRRIERYNDNPYAHHWFAKDL
jgi:GNAT superfamily N-acetyltransferase